MSRSRWLSAFPLLALSVLPCSSGLQGAQRPTQESAPALGVQSDRLQPESYGQLRADDWQGREDVQLFIEDAALAE